MAVLDRVLLALLSAAPAGDPAGPRVHVDLAGEARILRPRVHLEDVARITGPADLVSAYAAVDLDRAPAPGAFRVLTPAGIRLAAQLAGLPLAEDQIGGAPQVTLRPETRALDVRELVRAAEEFVKAELELAGDRLLVERPRQPLSVAVYPGLALAELEASWHGFRVPVGESVVTLFLRRFAPVLRLLAPAEKDEALRSSQVVSVEAEITELDAEPVRTVSELEGRVAARPLPAGRILTRDMLEFPVLVHRGDEVRVIYRRGGLEIVARAIAHRPGRQGDRIPVLNPDTQRVLNADILGLGSTGEVLARIE
jgi:flagella basal body P-ring formation protein FlgA